VLTAQVGSSADVLVSRDGGASWAHGALDATCSGYGSAVSLSAAWAQDGTAWMTCLVDGTVFETRDFGATWSVLGVLGSGTTAVAGAPGGSEVWAGAESGLWRYTPESGEFDLAGFEGRRVFALALSPQVPDDPTMFALTSDGSWWRSDDAGASWGILPAPDRQLPLAVALSPDFASDGVVAVSGYSGAWVSADRGATWRWANVLERHEETMPTWIFEGAWETWEGAGLSGGRGTRSSAAGDTAVLEVRGVQVDLLSTPGTDGVLAVSLDNGDAVEVPLAGDPVDQRVVWSSGPLLDAWHRVAITVVSGTVRLDAAQVWRQLAEGGDDTGDTDPETGDRPGTRCTGCDGSGRLAGGLATLLAALAITRTRRHRPCSSTRPSSSASSRSESRSCSSSARG